MGGGSELLGPVAVQRRENAMNELAMTARVVGSSSMPQRYADVRAATEELAASLSDEDQCVQSMPDASPAKWHRAHTTWFFEQFVLRAFQPDYQVFDTSFSYLFNSYYEAVGPRHPRPNRGLLTRPSTERIRAYRRHVDAAMMQLLNRMPSAAAGLIELGLQHEQQHQELLLTDMLHAFAQNPLAPSRRRDDADGEGPRRVRRALSIVMGDWYGSAMMPPAASASTTRRLRILHICRLFRSPRDLCATATGWHLSMTAAIARRLCGCRTVGLLCKVAVGRPRSVGEKQMECGGRWDCAVLCRSIRTRPCVTSAGTKPMRMRAGLMHGCRPRQSWRP